MQANATNQKAHLSSGQRTMRLAGVCKHLFASLQLSCLYYFVFPQLSPKATLHSSGHNTGAKHNVKCREFTAKGSVTRDSGVTTRGEVRQLPQGAKRQWAPGGRFWSTDCLLCTTEFTRISKERKKLKNRQNDRNPVYLYSFRYWVQFRLTVKWGGA